MPAVLATPDKPEPLLGQSCCVHLGRIYEPGAGTLGFLPVIHLLSGEGAEP
jgi:hypothetical protein